MALASYPNRNPVPFTGPPAGSDVDDALAAIMQQPNEPPNGYITPQDLDTIIRILASSGGSSVEVLGQRGVQAYDPHAAYAKGALTIFNQRVWIARDDVGGGQTPGADQIWRPVSLVDMPEVRWPPAPDWDNVQPYAKGELVWYQGQLWRALQAIPSGTVPPKPTEAAQPTETFKGYVWRHTTTGSTTGFQAGERGSLGTTLDHTQFRIGDRIVFYWTDAQGQTWGDAYTLVPPLAAMNTGGIVNGATGVRTTAPGARGTIQQGAQAENPGVSANALSPIIEQYNVRVFRQGRPLGQAPSPNADPTRWALVSGDGGAGVVDFVTGDEYDAGDLVWWQGQLYFALTDRAANGENPYDVGQTTWQRVERPQVHHALHDTTLIGDEFKAGDFYVDTDRPAIGWLGDDADPNDDTVRLFTAGPFAAGDTPGSDGGTPPQTLEDAVLQAADEAGRLAALRADPHYGDAVMVAATQPAHRGNQYVVIGGHTWNWNGTTWMPGPSVAIGGLLRHPVFTETMIRRWISEAQRFQGTIQEDVTPPATPILGSTQIKDMMIPEAANQGQYYIAVHDIAGATIVRTADPNHVPPIVAATYTLPDLTAGDWLMSTGNPNDATGGWARVPGGVLTISIADTLYVERTDTPLLVPATTHRDWLLASRPGGQAVWVQPTMHDQIMGAIVERLSGLTGEILWSDLFTKPDGAGGTDSGIRKPAAWPFIHDPQDPGTDDEDAGIHVLPDVGQTGTGNPMPAGYAATNLYVSYYDADGALGGGKFLPDVHHGGIIRITQGALWADYVVTGRATLPKQPGWTNFGGGAIDFSVRLLAVGPGGHPDMRYGGGGVRGTATKITYKFDAQGFNSSQRPGSIFVVADQYDIPDWVVRAGGKTARPGDLIRFLDTDGDHRSDTIELLSGGATGAAVYFAADATETPSHPGSVVLPPRVSAGSLFINGFRHEIWAHDGTNWHRVGHPQELPSWTIADAGKVLSLDPDTGELQWGTSAGHTVTVSDVADMTPIIAGTRRFLSVGAGAAAAHQYRPYQSEPNGNGALGIYAVGGQLRIEFFPMAHDNATNPTPDLLALPAGSVLQITDVLGPTHGQLTVITTSAFQVDTVVGRHNVVWASIEPVKGATTYGTNYHNVEVLTPLAGVVGDEYVNTHDHRFWVHDDTHWVERVIDSGVRLVADEAARVALVGSIPDGTLVVQQDTGWTWRYQVAYVGHAFWSPWRVFSDYVGVNTIGERDALAPHLHIGTLVSVGRTMYQYKANPDTTAGQPPGLFLPFGDHYFTHKPAEGPSPIIFDRGLAELGLIATAHDTVVTNNTAVDGEWVVYITGQARADCDLSLILHTGQNMSGPADAPLQTIGGKKAVGPWHVKAQSAWAIEVRGAVDNYGMWDVKFTGVDVAGHRIFDQQVWLNDHNARDLPVFGVATSAGNVYARARFEMLAE